MGRGGKGARFVCPLSALQTRTRYDNYGTNSSLRRQETFELWEIDFVGPLVQSHLGNRYIITAIDYATSKAIAWPLEERSAASAIEILENIICTYENPTRLSTTKEKN